MTEGHIPVAPSRKTLFTVLTGGVIAASAILMGAVLPAEYQIDPLGVGKAIGLLQMSRPAEVEIPLTASDSSNSPARFYAAAFRTDTVDIPLAASGDADGGDDLEWKVRMKTGETLIYSWSADAPPEEFYSRFPRRERACAGGRSWRRTRKAPPLSRMGRSRRPSTAFMAGIFRTRRSGPWSCV